MIYVKQSYSAITSFAFKKLLWRFILGYTSWALQYYSVSYLPLGVVQTIQNLSPFITLIFAYLILSESLKCLEISNMIASFVGVIIIVMYSHATNSEANENDILNESNE